MAKRLPNIVIFGIDSIRRDHMSCYGYPRLTTPYLDRLAAQSTLFENAFSAYIPTTPAYSTMLTGADVVNTQMPGLKPMGPLPEDLPTLPEVLHEAGYVSTCIGFDGGFYRGFDEYLNYFSWGSREDAPLRKAENLNEQAIPALEKMSASGKPFCLFLRHMDPHTPYLPPAPYDKLFYTKDCCDPAINSMEEVFACEAFADYFRSWMPEGITDADWGVAMYDSELAYMDACIEQLLQRMREMGIEEDTLVVVTGDHGETLLEHGCYFDHHGLYECTLVVPLYFYWPGKINPGVRSQATTLHEDLMPTILDLCGLKKFAKGVKFDGVSLKKYFADTEGSPRSEFYISECTWMRKEGWRTPIWKFWEALEPDFHGKPAVELYNLVEDPAEEKNLAKKEPAIAAMLKARKDAWVAQREKETGKSSNIKDYWIGTDKKIGSVATAQQLQAR